MKRFSAKCHIAIGQTCLLVSLLLVALYFGLVPDRVSAIREGRTALAEAIAASSSAFLSQSDTRRLEAILRFVVERNPDLLSAAVRRADGTAIVTIGEHERHWRNLSGEYSTDTQLHVPIWAGAQKWGHVELRSRPLTAPGWWGVVHNPRIQLVAFLGFCGFVLFYGYLTKMLRHLDPSQAIPERVRSALDTMAEGLLVIDLNGHIVLANQAFASVVGNTADALIGCHASRFPWATSNGAQPTSEDYPWSKALQEGTPQRNGMIYLRDAAGQQRTFMVNCSPVLGSGGKPGGVLISFDDVTLLEEKEVELRKSKEEAEAANRAKSAFLANMSHEIRTPMNAILGFTEILRRGYGKNEYNWKKHLNTIHTSGKHLLELINDILDLSKVESGHLEVERIQCAPHVIIREVVHVLTVKAREKAIALDFEVRGAIPETILSDPARLRQIVTNLAANAIKFTETGGVRVVVSLVSTGVQPQLSIAVIDSGIGMPAEKLDSIFDPFVQADSSVTRRFGGTGLGLTISRRFAQALGGDIVVQSELGKGSVFTVTIDTGPLTGVRRLEPHEILAAHEETVSDRQTPWQFPRSRGLRVLVVDDGAENRELVTLVLEEIGLRVDGAENGAVGVEKALREPFDVILMDMQMPVMDGWTATRQLRQRGFQTPIIALTAHAMKGYEEEIMAAGCSGYLTKPIDIDGLIQTLADLLGGQRLDADAAAPVPDTSAAESASPGVSPAVEAPLVSRLAVHNPRFRAIVSKFVQRLEAQLTAMEQAVHNRDFDELASLAHWLKGAGGTVGFDEFTDPAAHLEDLARARHEDQLAAALHDLRRLASRVVAPEETPHEAELVATAAAPVPGTSTAESTPPDAPPAVEAPLVSRLAVHNPRFRAIVSKFVQRLDAQLTAMEQAVHNRDFDELASLAHWLKGAGGTVGFDAFTEPAAHLEALAKAKNEDQLDAALQELQRLANRVVVSSDEKPQEAALVST